MATVTKIVVLHAGYGCDTGCCGHVIEVTHDGVEEEGRRRFHFDHDYDEEGIEYAKRLVAEELGAEHVADLDWENCEISTGDYC